MKIYQLIIKDAEGEKWIMLFTKKTELNRVKYLETSHGATYWRITTYDTAKKNPFGALEPQGTDKMKDHEKEAKK